MRHGRTTILPLTLAAVCLTLPGCEDEAARQRQALQETVASAAQTIREATLVVVEPASQDQFERTREQLNRVVRDLSTADTTGETGQEVAINALLADAGQKLAAMHLAEMEQFQAEVRDRSVQARAQVSAAQRMFEFARAAGSIDIADETSQLDSARRGASQQLSDISTMLAQLDDPIARLTSENRQDAERINELRQDAEMLVQRANELGPAEGFPQYEQALGLQREAGTIETQIARREIDLAYQYEPQHDTADSQAQQLQKFISTLDQATQTLNEIVSLVDAEVSRTNQQISAVRSDVNDHLASIRESIAGPIETAYQQGLDAADRAIRASRSAARGGAGSSGSAKMLEAQLLETQGRLHWARARALAQQINVLERVVAASDALGNVAEHQRALQAATDAYEQSISMARESYTAAQAAAPTNNDAMRRSIDLALGALSGQSVSDMNQAASASATTGASAPSNDGSGYDSPQALLAALRSIDPDRPETSMVLLDAVHTSTPLEVQFIDAAGALNQQAAALQQAVIDNLGQQVADDLSSVGAAETPDFTSASITSQDNETALIEASTLQPGMGQQTITLEAVRVDDGWRISFDSFAAVASPMGMSVSDSVSMMRAMVPVFADITSQLNNGQITSQQQFMTALQTGMMNAMSGQ